jgi:hypothetical protein
MKGMKISSEKVSFNVFLCPRGQVVPFIEKHHYSKNMNGVIADYCFAAEKDGKMIGAMCLGRLAMAGQWKKYGKKQEDVIELRRLVCLDDTARNTESYFIGKVLRWLKKNTKIKVVVSYADPEYGHSGVVYKASNFKLVGQSSAGRVIMFNGKKYHDKTIRTKYKGKLKPFAAEVKKALEDGRAVYKKTKGKNIYTYNL